jgi:Chitobiase/beta-hexosaminidase C-terminal domain/Bacterial Ig-like domain (group 2)
MGHPVSWLCLLFSLISLPAFATTFTVPSLTGASVQATLNSAAAAGSNNTVLLPAGLYNVSSPITVPCSNGLTVTGPVANPATAVLNATFSGNDIFNLSGCTGVTIQYLKFQNTGGIYVSAGSYSGINILHNQFGGLPSSTTAGTASQAAVYFDGNVNATAANNVVEFNTFGDSNSCTAVFASFNDSGGYCAGVYAQTGLWQNNLIEYNTFFHVEEGIHFHQFCDGCASGALESASDGGQVSYNYFSQYVRIAFEDQSGVANHTLTVAHNVVATPFHVSFGTYGFSMACCTGGRNKGSPAVNPSLLLTDNLLYTAMNRNGSNFSYPPYGIEAWGTNANYVGNWVMGGYGQSITWGFNGGGLAFTNNYLCAPIPAGSYLTNEEHSTPPILSGNTMVATCSQQTSTAATISPASGAYTSPPTITLSDAGVNTSIFYTVDGSNPVPGSGTTRLYTGPFPITLPVTVKAVGMWGDGTVEPLSYAAPYGFVPSAVQTASYTATGGVTLASVALNNSTAGSGPVHTLAPGASIQMSATCTYSDGSSSDCTQPDSHGDAVSQWNSSNVGVATVSSSGLVTGAGPGTATVTATVSGRTTPGWAMSVSAPAISLGSVALATTGSVASLAVSAVNQLVATCTYSDSSTTNCATRDAQGNVVSPWTSSAPLVASVSTTGVVTGQAAGSTNLTATVTPGATTTQWGQTAENTAGFTTAGFINSTYMVLGSQMGGYAGGTCSFYLPAGTLTVGSHFDCGLIPAPSNTTEGSAWQCWYTYTVTSSSAPGGFVSGPLSNCGNLAAGSAWWVAVATDAPGHPAVGFETCSSCYPYYYAAGVPYGTRNGLPATMNASGFAGQVSQFVTLSQPALVSNAVPLTVTAAAPTLVSAYLVSAGNVTTLLPGATLQFSARCVYSDSSTTDCTVADIHGNAVTSWITSDATVVTIVNGLATAVAAGAVNITSLIGSVTSSPFGLTVTIPAVTLTGLSLATTGGVTGLFVGASNALVATCIYSDGSTTNCTSTDSHGNVAGAYMSTAPAHATVNATTGVVTGVAAGTTTLTATAAGVSSIPVPLTVLALPSGAYTITITGPVSFSGVVMF